MPGPAKQAGPARTVTAAAGAVALHDPIATAKGGLRKKMPYSSLVFIETASNLLDLQMGHWSIYFVKLMEAYITPQSPQILSFLLNFPNDDCACGL